MKQYGSIECHREYNDKWELVKTTWTWPDSRIALVSMELLFYEELEIRRIRDSLIQIGPFKVRSVDRHLFLADEALVMRDGLLAVLVAGWFALTFRVKHAYYGFLSWLKHHGHMTTGEGERLSWRQFRLKYEPWPKPLPRPSDDDVEFYIERNE